MAGKYSAEWWEKIADINREISARHDPSSVVDDRGWFQGRETAPGWSQFEFCRSSRTVVGWGHTGPEGLTLPGWTDPSAKGPPSTPKPPVYYVGCSSLNSAPQIGGAVPYRGVPIDRRRVLFRYFAMIAGLNVPTKLSNGGSRHGRRCLAEQGGRILGEGTCDQRSTTCSASSRAGAQLSQVC
jgi:hypothetical protein